MDAREKGAAESLSMRARELVVSRWALTWRAPTIERGSRALVPGPREGTERCQQREHWPRTHQLHPFIHSFIVFLPGAPSRAWDRARAVVRASSGNETIARSSEQYAHHRCRFTHLPPPSSAIIDANCHLDSGYLLPDTTRLCASHHQRRIFL